MPSRATRGVLITSDEQSIIYLKFLDASTPTKFILSGLDDRSIFVRASAMRAINAALQKRLKDTIFTAENEGGDET
jgi:hypothetical protein